MSLFKIWSGTLVLPPLPDRRERIGSTTILQSPFGGLSCGAEIEPTQWPGHDLVTTGLPTPFDRFLFRRKGARRIDSDLPVLTGGDTETGAYPPTLEPAWDGLGRLATYAATPQAVREAWIDRFQFRTGDEGERKGLRLPQMGALHAIAAHFAIDGVVDPATVVLPTGTGKTETLLAALVYRRPKTVLMLVPTTPLRSQIAGKFVTLGKLAELEVIDACAPRPHVAVLSASIRSAEEAIAIADAANVIVTLPHALEASSEAALAALYERCDELWVDEAHHVSAKMWENVRTHFGRKKILQVTATPFRRDKERIDGRIIFNYRLGAAQDAGYYRPIHLVTVEEYGDQDARDRAIATEAIAALRRDMATFDHVLLARARTQDRAEALARLYAELAPDLRREIIHSDLPKRQITEALDRLHDRGANGSRIAVCVDMLGEGYDLPALKIAALHDHYKSLAITLQFVGRFTRKGDERIGDATVVANIADPETERRLSRLYSEGADWDHLLRRLSEERIDEELRIQDIVEGLKREGDLHDVLSLWNLRPPRSAQFFRTDAEDWSPKRYADILPEHDETWFSLDEAARILVAVVRRDAAVRWGKYGNIENTLYDLIILRWNKDEGVLSLYASDANGLRTEKMAQAVCGESAALVAGDGVFQVLNNVDLPLAKSLGSSRIGAISFTSYFGPNVTEGLASIEKSDAQLNNIACLGYEDGERVLWGCAGRRGKVWQHSAGSIADWMDFTDRAWSKISAEGEPQPNITRDFLRPRKLDAQYGAHPISVQWGEQAQSRHNDRQSILFGDVEAPLYLVDLVVGLDANGDVEIEISSETLASKYVLQIGPQHPGGYQHIHTSGPPLRFQQGGGAPLRLEEYLLKDPFVVLYVDGSYSYNCFHIQSRLHAGVFPRDRLEGWDWTGVPLNRESMHKAGDRDTIQYRVFERLSPEYDLVFNDDGSGEAADLVCLKDVDSDTIRLTLIHCKGAVGGRVSQSIDNFYVVCGQTQKSITAKHAGMATLYRDLKRRHELWAKQGLSRFLKGDAKLLSYFKEKARRVRLEFEVILVQPGASADTVTDNALRLLATTELYLVKTTQASVRVILSA